MQVHACVCRCMQVQVNAAFSVLMLSQKRFYTFINRFIHTFAPGWVDTVGIDVFEDDEDD